MSHDVEEGSRNPDAFRPERVRVLREWAYRMHAQGHSLDDLCRAVSEQRGIRRARVRSILLGRSYVGAGGPLLPDPKRSKPKPKTREDFCRICERPLSKYNSTGACWAHDAEPLRALRAGEVAA